MIFAVAQRSIHRFIMCVWLFSGWKKGVSMGNHLLLNNYRSNMYKTVLKEYKTLLQYYKYSDSKSASCIIIGILFLLSFLMPPCLGRFRYPRWCPSAIGSHSTRNHLTLKLLTLFLHCHIQRTQAP